VRGSGLGCDAFCCGGEDAVVEGRCGGVDFFTTLGAVVEGAGGGRANTRGVNLRSPRLGLPVVNPGFEVRVGQELIFSPSSTVATVIGGAKSDFCAIQGCYTTSLIVRGSNLSFCDS
jgi:hypothetical protein